MRRASSSRRSPCTRVVWASSGRVERTWAHKIANITVKTVTPVTESRSFCLIEVARIRFWRWTGSGSTSASASRTGSVTRLTRKKWNTVITKPPDVAPATITSTEKAVRVS